MKARASYVGLYGGTAMPKAWCPECDVMAFVLDGALACCGKPSSDVPERLKVEVPGVGVRRRPSRGYRRQQLERQGNRCLYCDGEFGACVFHRGNRVRLRTEWDHFVPFSYAQANPDENFVAACHICNGIKSDLIFQTVDEARVHILQCREDKSAGKAAS
jgi:hypothetical protein